MAKKRATRTKTAQAEKKAVAVIDSTPNEYTSIELMNELKEYIKENNGCSFYQILISNNTYTYFPKLYAFTLDVEHYDFGTLKADTSQAKIKNELCNRYGAVHTFDLLTLHEIEAMAGAYGSFCKDARTKGFFDYVFIRLFRINSFNYCFHGKYYTTLYSFIQASIPFTMASAICC